MEIIHQISLTNHQNPISRCHTNGGDLYKLVQEVGHLIKPKAYIASSIQHIQAVSVPKLVLRQFPGVQVHLFAIACMVHERWTGDQLSLGCSELFPAGWHKGSDAEILLDAIANLHRYQS
ncbi:hypothetical protein FRC02_006229 [Tulasnella sp. 418]|nr:hypothetical protein FRC02_006229 [Tulasnella sp. 418]